MANRAGTLLPALLGGAAPSGAPIRGRVGALAPYPLPPPSAAPNRSRLGEYWGSAGPDQMPPSFEGLISAVALDARTVMLEWMPGSDAVTPQSGLFYEVSWATSAGQPFVARRVVTAAEAGEGVCMLTLEEFAPETTYYFRVRCRDAASNVDSNTAEVQCTTPEDLAGKPQVSNISPSGGSIPADQPISFDVTDSSGSFRRVLVAVRFEETGQEELIHNGDVFTGYYSTLSRRTTIALGYNYVVRRLGGWQGSPTFRVYAFDKDGNEG